MSENPVEMLAMQRGWIARRCLDAECVQKLGWLRPLAAVPALPSSSAGPCSIVVFFGSARCKLYTMGRAAATHASEAAAITRHIRPLSLARQTHISRDVAVSM